MVKIGQVGSRWLKTGRDRSRLIDPRSSAALRRRRRECYKKRRCYYWILLDTRRYRVLRATDAGPDPPSPGSDSEDSSGAGGGKIMVRIGSVECGSGRLGLERFGRCSSIPINGIGMSKTPSLRFNLKNAHRGAAFAISCVKAGGFDFDYLRNRFLLAIFNSSPSDIRSC